MNHGERCGNFMLVVVLMDTFVEKRPVQYRMQEVKAQIIDVRTEKKTGYELEFSGVVEVIFYNNFNIEKYD